MNIFSNSIVNVWGDKGQRWLELLPLSVDMMASKWNLTNLKPINNLSYNYVLTGNLKSSNLPIVLKLGLDDKALEQEEAALRFYQGQGCVKLLDADLNQGVLLLEQITPGVSLKSLFPYDDELAVTYAVDVMRHLHKPLLKNSSGFRTIVDWLAALKRNKDLPEKYLHKACDLAEKLLKTSDTPVLLHGDLHHDNILLSQEKGWLAIDPKGVVGEIAFEVGAFICNPMPELLNKIDAPQIILRRLEFFSNSLNIDKHRLSNWSYIQAVLSACWAVEDKEDLLYWLTVAEIIDNQIFC